MCFNIFRDIKSSKIAKEQFKIFWLEKYAQFFKIITWICFRLIHFGLIYLFWQHTKITSEVPTKTFYNVLYVQKSIQKKSKKRRGLMEGYKLIVPSIFIKALKKVFEPPWTNRGRL